MALICIIVPVYRAEKYISRCIESIRMQTFSDFELLLVDDGSPDRCREICVQYALQDDRIKVIHQENKGAAAARNTGVNWAMSNSESEWLTFIDSDDWVCPEYLEVLLNTAKGTNTKISACLYKRASEYEAASLSDTYDVHVITPEQFWCNHYVTATIICCKLFSKDCFETIRFPEGIIHEDEFTTYKIIFKNKTISLVANPLYYYFINQDSVMLSAWTTAHLVALDACLEQFLYFKANHFSNAAIQQARRFVRLCGHYLDQIESCSINNTEKQSLIQKWLFILRQFIKENRELISFRSCPRGMVYSVPGIFKMLCWIRKLFLVKT